MHIVGAGSIGSLVAATVRNSTLILRNENRLLQYMQLGQTITIIDGGNPQISTKVKVPAQTGLSVSAGGRPISQLLVATKAGDTVAALQSLKSHLRPESTVILLQNGIGVENDIRKAFGKSCPQLAFSITSQGVKRTPVAWTFEHCGKGPIYLSSPTTVLEIDGFQTLSWPHFQAARVEKLLINAVINPLTAILGCLNGGLCQPRLEHLISRILRESCPLVNLEYGLELDVKSMQRKVLQVAENTATNTSSMLADIQNGSQTEINYINGHLVQLAKKHQKSATLNKFLIQMVELKSNHEQSLVDSMIPHKRSRQHYKN